MAKALFFDFFGVVGCEITSIWFRHHGITSGIGEIRQELFAKMDSGEITEDENYQLLSKRVGIPAETIKEEWRSMFFVNEELIKAIDELRKTHRTYILSNAASTYLKELIKRYDLARHFDGIYISAEMGKIKPFPEFYQHVLDDLGLEASEAVMTDDNAKNIEGAIKTGLNGIVFKNAEQYLKELSKID